MWVGRYHTSSQSSCPEEEEEEPDRPRLCTAQSHARRWIPLRLFPRAPTPAVFFQRRYGVRCHPHGREGEISPPGGCGPPCTLLSRSRTRGPRLRAVRPAFAPTLRRDGSRAPHPGRFTERQGAGGKGMLTNAPFTFGLSCTRTSQGVGKPLGEGAVSQLSASAPTLLEFHIFPGRFIWRCAYRS